MELVFVLVGPRHPGNIGAAARALKTMGFTQLRLVNPCAFDTGIPNDRGPAWQLAMYSHDILENAVIHTSLEAALADCDLAIGTTAKLRHHRHSVLTPPQLKDLLLDKKDLVQRAALVFGPEDTGLTNEHIEACNLLTSVPLAAPQPSINLAQAVMIYAWALSELPALQRDTGAREPASWAAAVAAIQQAAQTLGIEADPRVGAWLQERLPLLPARDLHMLFNLLKARQ